MIDSRFLTSRDADVNGDLPLATFDAESSAKVFNELARKVHDLYSRHASSDGKPLRWGLKHVDINNQAPYFLGSQMRQFLSKILYLTPNRFGERVNVSISPRWLLCTPGELFGEDLAEVIDEQICYLEDYSPDGCLTDDELDAAYAKKEKYFVLFDHPFETFGSGLWVNVMSGNCAEFVLNRNRPLATLSRTDVVWKPLQPLLESWLAAMNRDDWRLFSPGPLLREPYYHAWQVEQAVAAFHSYIDVVAAEVKSATGGAKGQRFVGQKAIASEATDSISPLRPVSRYVFMHDGFYGEEWNENLASGGSSFAREFLSRLDNFDFTFIAPGLNMMKAEDIRRLIDDQKHDNIRMLFKAADGYKIDPILGTNRNVANSVASAGARTLLLQHQMDRLCQEPGIYSLCGDRESSVYVITDSLIHLSKSHQPKPNGTSFHRLGRSAEGRSCILPATLPEVFREFEKKIRNGDWSVGVDGVVCQGGFKNMD